MFDLNNDPHFLFLLKAAERWRDKIETHPDGYPLEIPPDECLIWTGSVAYGDPTKRYSKRIFGAEGSPIREKSVTRGPRPQVRIKKKTMSPAKILNEIYQIKHNNKSPSISLGFDRIKRACLNSLCINPHHCASFSAPPRLKDSKGPDKKFFCLPAVDQVTATPHSTILSTADLAVPELFDHAANILARIATAENRLPVSEPDDINTFIYDYAEKLAAIMYEKYNDATNYLK